jgi:hypothetical protein
MTSILWSLYCQSFFDLRLLITPLVSCAIVLLVLFWFTASDYTFGILLCSVKLIWITLGIKRKVWGYQNSSDAVNQKRTDNTMTTRYQRCNCIVSPFLIYGFWLHLWYLVVIVLSVLFWFTASDYTFGILCHCIVSPFLIYGGTRHQRCNQKP